MTLDEIPAIVLGMQPGELKEPYHPTFTDADVQLVHTYACARGARELGSATQAYPLLIDLARAGHRKVELFGAFAEACVAQAVVIALGQGMEAIVPAVVTHSVAYGIASKDNPYFLYSVAEIAQHSGVRYTAQYTQNEWHFTPQRI